VNLPLNGALKLSLRQVALSHEVVAGSSTLYVNAELLNHSSMEGALCTLDQSSCTQFNVCVELYETFMLRNSGVNSMQITGRVNSTHT
jgi:hypothetical protein